VRAAVLAFVLVLFGSPRIAEEHGATTRERRETEFEVIVSPEALRARRAGLLSDLMGRAEGREDLPEGLRLRLAPTAETLATVARAVEAERHCCRFLRFGITVEPH
jgi:hypothetical protein